jgi:flotillin
VFDFLDRNGSVLAIVGIILVLGLIVLAVARRYKIPQANEALVITGARGSEGGVKIALGSGAFIVPFIQKCTVISLEAMRIELAVSGGVSKDNIKVRVDAVAQAKVDGTPEGVRAAAQRFLDSDNEIANNIRSILAGALRGVIGNMTVEEMLRDREGLATKIRAAAIEALSESGLRVDTLQINDIVTDPEDYITNLGRPQVAETRRLAEIAEADNERQSAEARATARVAIAQANKDAALKEADFKAQTDEAQAVANAVGPKTKAGQDATITKAEQANAEQQVQLAKLMLDAEVRAKADADLYVAQKKADAALYTAEQDAKAQAAVIKQQGQGHAEATRVQGLAEAEASQARGQAEAEVKSALAKREGQGEAEATRALGLAQAEAIKAQGLAEAEAIRAKGQAEAEVKELLAAAYEKYGQQAVIDRILAALPEMLAGAARPIGDIDNLTVIGGAESASGVTKLATNLLTELPAVVKAATGLDLGAWLTSFMAARGPGAGPSADIPQTA